MTRRVKIGVNGWFFCRQFTGIGRYSLNVFSELARLFPDLEFLIAVPGRLDEDIDKFLRYQENLKFELIPENPTLKRINAGLSKCFWEKEQLNRFFRENSVDLIHLPYPALYKKIKSVPVIITIHDTIPWTDKLYRNRGLLSGLYNRATQIRAGLADYLITVSQQSKKEILTLPGFNKDKLEVVYNASEFNDAPDFSPQEMQSLLKKLGLKKEDRFLFYMGGFDKRKNVQRLIDVFSLKIAPESELKLVIGGANVLSNNLFEKLCWDEEHWGGRIVKTGFLNNSELIMLYRQAWAYFSLTTREGFNLPLLEALTLGCPALVSDLAVHREVAGDVPVFLNLNDSDDRIADSILNLYNYPDNYQKLEKKTADFADLAGVKYSWLKAAKQVGEIYLKLIK
jgi:glycosyltransferase involved in cell wall biosynthesis